MKEVKTFPFEVKVNTSKRTIEGYASTFGNRDLVGDIVQEGAFKKTIVERAKDIKFLWQHWEPLGKPLQMEEDSKGLYVESYVSKTTLGNDALELAQDGVIDKFSIGYDVLQDEYDEEKGARLLKELKLYEFSLVTFPANPQAGVTGVKSYDEFTQYLHKTGRLDVTKLLKQGTATTGQDKALIETAIKALKDALVLFDEPGKPTHKSVNEPPKINRLDGVKAQDLKELAEYFKIKA